MQLGLAYLDAKLILSELSGQRVKKYMNNSFFEKEQKKINVLRTEISYGLFSDRISYVLRLPPF